MFTNENQRLALQQIVRLVMWAIGVIASMLLTDYMKKQGYNIDSIMSILQELADLTVRAFTYQNMLNSTFWLLCWEFYQYKKAMKLQLKELDDKITGNARRFASEQKDMINRFRELEGKPPME